MIRIEITSVVPRKDNPAKNDRFVIGVAEYHADENDDFRLGVLKNFTREDVLKLYDLRAI